MAEHEKIRFESEAQRRKLYEDSNRLLATVNYPEEELGSRLRRFANSRFFGVTPIVLTFSVLLGFSMVNATAEHVTFDNQERVKNVDTRNLNIDCAGRLLIDYNDRCYLPYNERQLDIYRYANLLIPTPTPTFIPTPSPISESEG